MGKPVLVGIMVSVIFSAAIGCSSGTSNTAIDDPEFSRSAKGSRPDLINKLENAKEMTAAASDYRATVSGINERRTSSQDHDRALALTDIAVRHAESLRKDMEWDDIWKVYQSYLAVLVDSRLKSGEPLAVEQANVAEAFKARLDDLLLAASGSAEPGSVAPSQLSR